jgi:hypothetical protein
MRPSLATRRRLPLALFLAGAIFALTAMAGPDTVQHLRASAKDHRDCAVYHWTHGTGAGAPTCFAQPAPPPAAGPAAPERPAAAPHVAVHPAPSRAPPAIL